MKIEIIAIGNELISGELENKNSSWVARELNARGFEVSAISAIGDDEAAIEDALTRSRAQTDAVIVLGGLGLAIKNDVSVKAAARAFQCPLILNHELEQVLKERLKQRGQDSPFLIEKLASLPQNAEFIDNPLESVPGFLMDLGEKTYFFLPETPMGLKYIFLDSVLPHLEKKRKESLYYRSKNLNLFGLTESSIAERLSEINLGTYSGSFFCWSCFPINHIRIWVRGKSKEEVENNLNGFERQVAKRFGDYLVSKDSTTMEEVVGNLLRSKGATMAVAESCTGGLLGHLLTSIPGSSTFFERGIVAYSNEAKMELLHVPKELLSQCGAVSAPVAEKMAEGVRKISGTTIGLGLTGIAGPSGGTPEKPVGTVFIALASPSGTSVRKYHFDGSREQIKLMSAYTAMDWVRRFFLAIP